MKNLCEHSSDTATESEQRNLINSIPFSGPDWWAGSYWTTFHFTAATTDTIIPEERRPHLENFYKNFGRSLPCKHECADHYQKEYAKNPAPLCCRFHLFQWTVNFHNAVTERINQRIRAGGQRGPEKPTFTFEQAVALVVRSQQPGNKGGLGGADMMEAMRHQPKGTISGTSSENDGNVGLSRGVPWGWIIAVIMTLLLLSILILIIVRSKK